MARPTARVLTLLELLQSGGTRTVSELAGRLDVDERTVRRYVRHLLELDVPVESVRGRYGGYRLASGYRMPPLMLSDDEALAVLLGLVAGRRAGLMTSAGVASETAAAKVRRVLPERLGERLDAVLDSLAFTSAAERSAPTGPTGPSAPSAAASPTGPPFVSDPADTTGPRTPSDPADTAGPRTPSDPTDPIRPSTPSTPPAPSAPSAPAGTAGPPSVSRPREGRPAASAPPGDGPRAAAPAPGLAPPAAPRSSILLPLADAVRHHRPVRIRYASADGRRSERTLHPYGLVAHAGRWYVTGADPAIGEDRTFRVDRVLDARTLPGSFEPPAGVDPAERVLTGLATAPYAHAVSLRVQGTAEQIRSRMPAGLATLTEVPAAAGADTGAQPTWFRFELRVEQLDWLPAVIASLDRPFVIDRPVELRSLVADFADRLARSARSPHD
ncbi:transcriptional regulator [Streptomyces sp. NPDC006632]|uniref:helix-turn-helix transcriptional regulator n=1 Tax=Streptomyces sp. NPDC006632 TaxID=3157182 RepID=UPI0033A89BBF